MPIYLFTVFPYIIRYWPLFIHMIFQIPSPISKLAFHLSITASQGPEENDRKTLEEGVWSGSIAMKAIYPIYYIFVIFLFIFTRL